MIRVLTSSLAVAALTAFGAGSALAAPPPFTPAQIYTDTAPVLKTILTGLMLLAALSIGAAIMAVIRRESAARMVQFLKLAIVAAPAMGILGAAYGVAMSFIGTATMPNTNLAVIAPGMIEVAFSVALGFLAQLVAIVALGVAASRRLSATMA